MNKRKSFPIYMDWKPIISKLSPEEVKIMILGMMEFYAEGVIPNFDEDKYPRLDMFFADKLQHMAKLEDDRIKKLQEYQGASKSLEEPLGGVRRVKEAVNVDVGVDVDVPVNVPVEVPVVVDVSSNVDVPVNDNVENSKLVKHTFSTTEEKDKYFEELFGDVKPFSYV